MAINAPFTKGSEDFEPVPAGNHVARVFQIVHIGTNLEDSQWGPKEFNKVRITFELPNETKEFKEGEGEKPYVISQEYTISMHEKANLRAMVEGVLGVSFHDTEAGAYDIEELIGKVCMLNIVHRKSAQGKTYANIASVAQLPKGMTAPEPVNKPIVLNYDDKWSDEVFNGLSDFVKKKMETSNEYKAMRYKEANGDVINETDIPF